MRELESRVLDAIDLDGLVATLCELITYPSCDGQEVEVQQRMSELLDEAGLETDTWEIDMDAMRRHPAYGAEIERERAVGVVGWWGDGAGPLSF